MSVLLLIGMSNGRTASSAEAAKEQMSQILEPLAVLQGGKGPEVVDAQSLGVTCLKDQHLVHSLVLGSEKDDTPRYEETKSR